MTIYNVHIYREMRLVYEGISAETPEAAAAIARKKPTDDSVEIADCEGETLSAVVDEAGDSAYERSVMIAFENERLRTASPALLAACRMIVDRWERGDLAEAARACQSSHRRRRCSPSTAAIVRLGAGPARSIRDRT